MGLIERLKVWVALRKVRPEAERPEVAAGREGEQLLSGLLGLGYAAEGGDAWLQTGARIPSRRQGRRREIDLVVGTPGAVYLVEVKNWSGSVSVVGGAWRQARRGGDVIDHGDLLRENERRREAVVEYLRDRGLAIDPAFARDRLIPALIFMNPNLTLPPEVEARPDVVSRRELDAQLGRRGGRRDPSGLFLALMDVYLARDPSRAGGAAASPIEPTTAARIRDAFAEASTWDQLQLHGARAVSGDLLRLTIGGKTYRADDLPALADRGVLRLRWSRNPWIGLFLAITGLLPQGRVTLGRERRALSPDDTAVFHAAGDRDPTTHRLIAIDRILLGKPAPPR